METTWDTVGQALHTRLALGEVLTPLEQERLAAYYAMMEAQEESLLAPGFARITSEHSNLQKHLQDLSALVVREEQYLARLRELRAERQVLNSERQRLLAA
jgi:hypothetical protein